MRKTMYRIAQMDCPTEEQMIRMKLQAVADIARLDFNIGDRTLTVFHSGDNTYITQAIHDTGFASEILSSSQVDGAIPVSIQSQSSEKKMLYTVLAINAFFFVFEMVAGLLSNSMGLVADSLDMLADAIVYSLSLIVVGKAVSHKKQVATISGYFQLTLATIGFVEVIRRFLGFGEMPVFQSMVAVSFLALVANMSSLFILKKARNGEAHLKASWIFTSNDIIINIGVIVAGILVFLTNSKFPDLIVGGIVFVVVVRGALRILKLGKT